MSYIVVKKGIVEPWQFQFSGTDITSMNVYFYIKANKSDTDADALYTDTFTTATHSDPTNGLTASRNQIDTSSIPTGTHWYEARLFSGGVPIDTIIGQVAFIDTVIDKTSE